MNTGKGACCYRKKSNKLNFVSFSVFIFYFLQDLRKGIKLSKHRLYFLILFVNNNSYVILSTKKQ